MKRSHVSSFFFITLLLCSCGKSLPSLDDMDLKSWEGDKNGCLGKRASMEKALDLQKNKLLGLSEAQIATLLGRPDDNELYTRNQKFYHYFVQPSKKCNAMTPSESPRELIIRFTAMGIANEVSVE